MTLKHLTLILLVLTFFSCKKEKEGCTDSSATNFDPEATKDNGTCEYSYNTASQDNNLSSASNYASTAIYEDMILFTYAQYETDNNSGLEKKLAETPIPLCATLNIEPTSLNQWPKNLTIDFGNSNCLCTDGKNRRGKIEVRINDSWRTPSVSSSSKDSIIISLTNYFVNDTMITGKRIFVKDSLTASLFKISAIVSEASVIFPGNPNDTISWSYNGYLNLDLGLRADYNDNVISINIDGQIKNKGKIYLIETTNNLVMQFSCINSCIFTSGDFKLSNTETEEIKVGNTSYAANVNSISTVNFGSGTCDGILTLSKNLSGITVSGGKELYNESSSQEINCSDYLNWE